MANLILNWLNDELKLSRKVNIIEDDFANGYLFGEILNKYKMINNFNDYKDREELEIKMNNFKNIEKTFKNLSIKIENAKLDEILRKKRGIASKCLYQLKMSLSKKEINFENILQKKSPILMENTQNQINLKINEKKNEEDKNNNLDLPTIFSKSPYRNKQNLTSNDLYTELNPVMRFEKFQKEQEIIIKAQKKIQEEFQKNERNNLKNYNLGKILYEIDKNLYTKNSEKKKPNEDKIEIKELEKINENKLLEEMNTQTKFYKKKILEKLNLNENNNDFIQIENFEKNISKLGLDLASIDPKLKKFSKMEINSEIILNKIQNKIKTETFYNTNNSKKKETNFPSKRKLDTIKTNEDFFKLKTTKNFNKSKNILFTEIGNNFNISNLEKRLEYENFRNLQNRELIKENKKKQYEKKILGNPNNSNFYSNKNNESFKSLDNSIFLNSLLHEKNLKTRQKELSVKISKRKINNFFMKKLSNYVIDFVEEIFHYQKKRGNEEILIEDWRKWTSTFINNQPFSVSLQSNTSYFEDEKSSEENEYDLFIKTQFNETLENEINNINPYEDCEMLDYLNFLGKYKQENYNNQDYGINLDIYEIMGNDLLLRTNNLSKSKTSKFKTIRDYEPNDDDLENLTIPKNNVKNFFFSEIIEIITDLKFSELNINNQTNKFFNNDNISNSNLPLRMESSRSEISSKNSCEKFSLKHIPLKLALIGKAFSGKKTQAKLLCENYPLKIYSVMEMIKINLELLEKENTFIPFEINPKFKNLKKNELEKLIAEKLIEDQKFDLIKPYILTLKNKLENESLTEESKQEGIIEFCIEIIKHDFPEKSSTQIIEEIINKNKRKKELLEELSKLKDEKNIQKNKGNINKNESSLRQELHKINLESNTGFILLDFPNNFSQVKILEKKLTGYEFELEQPKSEIDKIKDNFFTILDKFSKPENKNNFIQGGLDLLIYLDADPIECLRRFNHRKVDPTTGTIYHLEDNPPNHEDKKLYERLVDIEDIHEKETKIIENFYEFNLQINQIINFYNIFSNQKIKNFNRIKILSNEENKGKDYKDQLNSVNTEITQLISHIIKLNEEKENELLNLSNKTHKNNKENNGNISHLNNNNNSYLNNITGNLINPSNIIHSVNDSNLNTSNNKESQKTNQLINSNLNNDLVDRQFNDEFQVQNLDEEDFNKYLKKFGEAKKKISSFLTDDIYVKWIKVYENYTSSIKGAFKSIKKQKENIITNYNKLQEKFIEFLRRPSKKYSEIQKFQLKYNKFLDEYPELKNDSQVKEEFRQDVSDIQDRVWEVIEERKSESIQERLKIMQSGWIEKEMEKFYFNIEKIFCMEAEKFYTSINIIRQFYLNLDSKLNNDFSNFKPLDILIDEELNINPLEKEDKLSNNFSYPKLEIIYKNCIKIILKFDDLIKSVEKLVKTNTANKSLDFSMRKGSVLMINRNMTKKLQADATFVEEKKDIFLYEEEMKNAIKQEKDKYKYRITFLKIFGVEKLRNIRKVSNVIYDKLDEWIIKTIKKENDFINSMSYFLESHIERECKIRIDVENEIFEDFQILNVKEYFEIENIPKNLIEKKEHRKINSFSFLNIFKEIKTHEIYPNYIRTQTFLDIFIKKYHIDKKDNGIPYIFEDLTFINFKKFVINFENIIITNQVNSSYNDILNVKEIFTIILLLEYKILNKNFEENIFEQAKSLYSNYNYLSKENFKKIKFWFENENNFFVEMSKNNLFYLLGEENKIYEEEIKDLLFEINKDDLDFVNILSLKFLPSSINSDEISNSNLTYAEFLLL